MFLKLMNKDKKKTLKQILLTSTCIVALTVSACSQVGAPSRRNAEIPAPIAASERPQTINEGYEPVIYVPLGKDVLVPESMNYGSLPDTFVGPLELRNETLASALQLILEDFGISLVFESEEGLSRRVTVSGLKGPLNEVVSRICGIADLYCSYESGSITIKEVETFTVSLPPIGEGDVFTSIGEGLEAITGTAPVIDTSTRTMIYTATSRTARQAEAYFGRLRSSTALVVFETYIWEVSLDGGSTAGIQWDLLDTFGEFNFGVDINGAVDSQVGSPISIGLPTRNAVDYSTGSLLRFLSSQGTVKTISQPQLTVLSGSEASLRVAETRNYVESLSRTTDDNGDETVSTTTSSVDSGFTLTIGSNWDQATVYGDVSIELDEFLGFESFSAGSDETLQLPRTSERDLTTQVRVRPGDSVLIAGLVKEQDEFDTEGPGFAKPIFPTSRTAKTSNQELVFLLRPRVIAYVPEEEQKLARTLDSSIKKGQKTDSLLRQVMNQKRDVEQRLQEIERSLLDGQKQKTSLEQKLTHTSSDYADLDQARQTSLEEKIALESKLEQSIIDSRKYKDELDKIRLVHDQKGDLALKLQERLETALIDKGRLETSLSNAKSKLTQAETALEASKISQEKSKSEIARLAKELDAARNEQAKAISELNSSKVSVISIEQALELAQTEKNATLSELKELQTSLSKQDIEKEAIQEKLSKSEQRLKTLNSALIALKDEKTAADADLLTISKTLESVEEQKTQLQMQVLTMKQKLEEAEQKLLEKDGVKLDQEASLRVLEEDLNQARAENTLVRKQLEEKEKGYTEVKIALTEAETLQKQNKESFAALKKELEAISIEKQGLLEKVNQSNGILSTFELEYKDALAKQEKISVKANALEEKLSAVTAEKSTLNASYTQAQEQIATLQDALSQASIQKAEKGLSLDAQRSKNSVLEQKLAQEIARTASLETKIGQADRESENLRSEIERFKQNVSEKTAQYDVIVSAYEQAQAEKIELLETVKRLETVVAEKHDMITVQQAGQADIEGELISLKSMLDKATGERESVLEKLKNSQQILSDAQKDYDILKSAHEKTLADLEKTKEELSSTLEQNTAIQVELQQTQATLSLRNDEIAELKTRLTDKDAEIATLKQEIILVKSSADLAESKSAQSMSKLTAQNEALSKELIQLKEYLQQAEQRLNETLAEKERTNERLNVAEKALEAAETKKEALQASLNESENKSVDMLAALEKAQQGETKNTDEINALKAALAKSKEEQAIIRSELEIAKEKASKIEVSYIDTMKKQKAIEADLASAKIQRDEIAQQTVKFGSFNADLLNPGLKEE